MQQVVILHTGALGDMLQLIPMLAALRQRQPQAAITLLGHPSRGRLLQAGGLIDELADVERCGLHRLFAASAAAGDVPEPLRQAELIVDFLTGVGRGEGQRCDSAPAAGWFSGNLCRLTAARVVTAVSFPSPGATDLPAAQFVYDQLREPLELPQVEDVARRVALDIPDALLEGALSAAGLTGALPPPGRLVTLHPGSGSRRKNWPLQRFLELAEAMRSQGAEVHWLLGPAELERAEFGELRRGEHGGLCLCLNDLLAVAAVLTRSAVHVGNDSGITHLSAALGRPTLALFGPSDAGVWAPRQRGSRLLTAPGGDLAALPVAEVLEALAATCPVPGG